ncbi:MAG: hypothetical protein ACTSQI_14010 [Candidatus Helarchaeota archaeon]
MNVWITIVGWQPFAVINPIWAACFFNKFIPNKVVLLNNGARDQRIGNNVALVRKWLEKILREYGITNPDIQSRGVNEGHIMEFFREFSNIVLENREHVVVLDMTPGRKFMSSSAFLLAFKNRTFVRKLFYLHLKEQKYQDTPFVKIPLIKQDLINMLEL